MELFPVYRHGHHHVKLRLPPEKLQEGLRIVSELSAAQKPEKPGRALEELETDPEALWWYQRHLTAPCSANPRSSRNCGPKNSKTRPNSSGQTSSRSKRSSKIEKANSSGGASRTGRNGKKTSPKPSWGFTRSMWKTRDHSDLSGNIPGEAKRRIAENLTYQLPDIPINIIITEQKENGRSSNSSSAGFDLKDNTNKTEDE